MIDIHTHILPGIDDGARNVEESLLMLSAERAEGARRVALTPHFYADENILERFISQREDAFAALKARCEADHPELLLGAEVAYYSGISRSDALGHFTIGDSRALLLEMPEDVWSDYMIREVEEIARVRGINVIIAHAERCLDYQGKRIKNRLFEAGVLIQANASFFINPKTRRRALKLLASGEIHFVASDAHGIEYRPTRIGEALEIIKAKLGQRAIERLELISREIFG